MNFKKTALVLAMAGVVAAPMAAQASAGDGAYASVRIGIQSIEAGAAKRDTQVSGYSSRFGFKSETDLGNGMTGFGKYEFAVDTDVNTSGAVNASGTGTDRLFRRRHAMVGLKGDFGKVTLGQTYHTFYNHVVGVNDNPWAGSGYAMIAYRGRTDQSISYAGGAGAISYGVTLQMDGTASNTAGDAENIDALELGFSFDAGFGTFGLGYIDAKGVGGVDPDPVTGLALSGVAAGPVTLGFGYQTQDVGTASRSSFLIDALIGNGYVHYEALDVDAAGGTGDKTSLAVGYTMSLGPQTSAWFEYHDVDTDTATGSVGDSNELRAILKYDI